MAFTVLSPGGEQNPIGPGYLIDVTETIPLTPSGTGFWTIEVFFGPTMVLINDRVAFTGQRLITRLGLTGVLDPITNLAGSNVNVVPPNMPVDLQIRLFEPSTVQVDQLIQPQFWDVTFQLYQLMSVISHQVAAAGGGGGFTDADRQLLNNIYASVHTVFLPA